MPLIFPGGAFLKKSRDAGGKAEKKAKQSGNQTPGPDDAKNQILSHQQNSPCRAQQNGNAKHPAAEFSAPDSHAFILPLKIDEVVNLHFADALSAFPKGVEVNQDEIEQGQPRRWEGERQCEMIRQAEHGKQNRPQNLVEQSAKRQSQCKSRAAHRQIFQEEQPRYLPVCQPNQYIGSQFPAPAGKHELSGIAYQPAENAHNNDAGQDDYGRQRSHFF